MKQYYTDKKYKELLSHMVVLVDTRENTNKMLLIGLIGITSNGSQEH